MTIKICGLQRPEDADYISEFEEIKYAGFVFFEKSRRNMMPERVLEIKKRLRPDIKTVGVFAEHGIDEIIDLAKRAELDICQLHSDESNADCGKISLPVWKAIVMKDASALEKAEDYTNADGFVLDSDSGNKYGGTGRTFDWQTAESFSRKYFTVLAGGISHENILRAYGIVKPNVVDLSSSVEENGYKSYEKIKQLIHTVRKGENYGN